jgi:hypothetical protein
MSFVEKATALSHAILRQLPIEEEAEYARGALSPGVRVRAVVASLSELDSTLAAA